MATAGYSGTSLTKKLGFKEGFVVRIVNAPENYFDLVTDLPEIKIQKSKRAPKDLIHYFTKSALELSKDIAFLRKEIKPNGMIWVSWPKKTSKVKTDVTEDVIRDLAIWNGLVDVKVCAVDNVWSGLKLVIPVKKRKK